MNTQDLAIRFSESTGHQGFTFDCQLIPGDTDVIQIVVSDFEEIPVYISITETQILCISYLWSEAEVLEETRAEMLELMLEINIPMPLSSFSKISDKYVIFGALMADSSFDDVVHEVITLAENSVEAITALSDYLK
ncbi:hypothetical protein A9Q99_20080 [Gammaproteobacteria bacterium 45_16_T64]|nr:hypothetical protein A9Q99_20080 [Gammaproteobacteria bacterium 45_16_T64]